MQPRGDIGAIPDATMHESKMLDRIEAGAIGIAGHFSDRRLHRKAGNSFDERLARLSVSNEIGDGYPGYPVACRKIVDLRTPHHGAIVINQFADHPDGRQTGQAA